MLVVGVIPDHKVTLEVKVMLVAKDTLEAMGILVAWVILVARAQQLVTQVVMDILAA